MKTKPKIDTRQLVQYSFVAMAVMIFAWGVALRSPETMSGNYLFGFDHGRDYLAAYDIAVNHKLTLIGAEVGAGSAGLTGLFHGPGYFYIMALMYLLFRGDPYGGLVLMFAAGVTALVLVFVSFRRMFGNAAALTALFLTGVSPLIAPQSRFIWNHHLTSPFIVLVLFFVYRIPSNPRLFVPLSLFSAGFIYHFELAIAVPLVLAILLSLPVVFRIRDFRVYASGIAAVILAFLPMALFEARHGFMAVRGLFGYMSAGGTGGGIPWQRISGHFDSYVNNAKDTFPIEGGFLPVDAYLALCMLLVLGMIFIAFRAKAPVTRLFFRFLLIVMVVSYGIFLLLNNTVWDYYLIHIHFIFIIAFSFLFSRAIGHIRSSPAAWVVTLMLSLFLLSMAVSSWWRMDLNWRMDYPDYGGVEKIKGKRAVIDYVYEKAAGKPFNAMVFMAPIYTYPYEYLFKTYGMETYGYIPGKEKSGDVFLILEKDSQDWYKGWLETVVAGGEVLSSEVIHTGHLVEHRYFASETKR